MTWREAKIGRGIENEAKSKTINSARAIWKKKKQFFFQRSINNTSFWRYFRLTTATAARAAVEGD